MGIDTGTFESKGVIIDSECNVITTHSAAHGMENPKPNYFEHDAEQVWWHDFCEISNALLEKAKIDPKDILAVGASALSGVMDFRHTVSEITQGGWLDVLPQELTALLGDDTLLDAQDDLLELVRKQASNPNRPRMIQICGTEDFLYADNLRFREAAERAGYGHTYLEWEGEHAWPFWDVAVQRVFQFFRGMNLEHSCIF